MTSTASWRTSGESPNFPYFVATWVGEFGSFTVTTRPVNSKACPPNTMHSSYQLKKTRWISCFVHPSYRGSPSIVTILCDVNHAPLLPLSLDQFPPNFPRTRGQVVARSRHMASHSRKVSIKGSNLPETLFFRVPYLWSAYGSRETFCDAYTLSIP